MVTSDEGKPKQNKRGGVPFSNRWPLSEGCKGAEGGSHAAIQGEYSSRGAAMTKALHWEGMR